MSRYIILSLILMMALGCSQDERPFHLRVQEDGVLITTIIEDSSLSVSDRGNYEDALHDYLLKREIGMVNGSAVYSRSGNVVGLSLSMRVLNHEENIEGISELLLELGAAKDTLLTIHDSENQQVVAID